MPHKYLINSYLFLIVNNMAPFNITTIYVFSHNDLPQPYAYRPIDNCSASYCVNFTSTIIQDIIKRNNGHGNNIAMHIF